MSSKYALVTLIFPKGEVYHAIREIDSRTELFRKFIQDKSIPLGIQKELFSWIIANPLTEIKGNVEFWDFKLDRDEWEL